MGYCMNQRESNVCIKNKNFAAALAAIKALASTQERMGGGSSTGEKWYSWVSTEEFVKAETLADALRAWRWDCYIAKDSGDLEDLSFNGEKLGNDQILLETIAPFVEKGGFIEMEGEDGSLWRWRFDGKTMDEVNATVTWPE